MKTKIKLSIAAALFLLTALASSQPSVLTISTGTSLGVLTGADLCAGTINGNGVLYGGGSICGGIVSVDPVYNSEVPSAFGLSQNYPNPFNPVTSIKYQISSPGYVTIILYNMLGGEVAKLVSGEHSAGFYEAKFDASHLASGIYLYKITAGEFTKTMKMSLIK